MDTLLSSLEEFSLSPPFLVFLFSKKRGREDKCHFPGIRFSCEEEFEGSLLLWFCSRKASNQRSKEGIRLPPSSFLLPTPHGEEGGRKEFSISFPSSLSLVCFCKP
jgi:hypothetical protein